MLLSFLFPPPLLRNDSSVFAIPLPFVHKNINAKKEAHPSFCDI